MPGTAGPTSTEQLSTGFVVEYCGGWLADSAWRAGCNETPTNRLVQGDPVSNSRPTTIAGHRFAVLGGASGKIEQKRRRVKL